MGAVFHYDLHVFDGKKYQQNGASGNRTNPIPDFQIFSPEKLDTDQWIKSAKDAGFKFALLTATHETGFALFPSDVNPYNVKSLRWKNGKGDVVRDFVNSCRKYGIKPGIYLGIRWNSFFGVYDFKVQGEGEFQRNRQAYYNRMVEGMVTEICTRYGELFEIWFDGGAHGPEQGGPDVLSTVEKYQPKCLFYHNLQRADMRWGGSESGTVSYPCWSTFSYASTGAGETARPEISANNYQLLKTGDPDGKYWLPAMSDAPLRGYNGRHEWFWEPDDEEHIFPLENLMNMYYKSVGRNSTLIMGLTPDPSGLLPEPDVKRLKAWGDEIKRRFESPIASISGEGEAIELKLADVLTINHVVLQEDISNGERVQRYKIEGLINDKWVEVGNGECIGNKRIQLIDAVATDSIRLIILESKAKPLIKNFSVYLVK